MDDTKGHHDGETPYHGEGATLAGYLKRIDSEGITSMIQNENLGWMMQYKTHLPVHVRDSIRNDQDLVLALVYASMQVEQWLRSDSSPLRKLADAEHELDKIDDQLRMMASRIDTYNSYMAETFTFHPLGDREAQKFRQCFHCLAVDLEHRVVPVGCACDHWVCNRCLSDRVESFIEQADAAELPYCCETIRIFEDVHRTRYRSALGEDLFNSFTKTYFCLISAFKSSSRSTSATRPLAAHGPRERRQSC